MNSGSDSNAGNSTEMRNTRSSRLLKGVDSVTRKFLRDFDPQSSEREKRKLHRRFNPGSKKHVYDERGFQIKTGQNLCDCLQADCPGCHFPCPKCDSTKCAHECRNNRKWMYDSIENEGSDIVMKNPLKQS